MFVFISAVLVVAVIHFVTAADFRPVFIDCAPIFFIQEFAPVCDVDIPVTLFHKHADSFMGEVPADIIIIRFFLGRFNRQSEILTAQSGTFFA